MPCLNCILFSYFVSDNGSKRTPFLFVVFSAALDKVPANLKEVKLFFVRGPARFSALISFFVFRWTHFTVLFLRLLVHPGVESG